MPFLSLENILWWGFAGLPFDPYLQTPSHMVLSAGIFDVGAWGQTVYNRNEEKQDNWRLKMSSECYFSFPLMTRTQHLSIFIGILFLTLF